MGLITFVGIKIGEFAIGPVMEPGAFGALASRGDCQIFCARDPLSSLDDEPFAEDHGELGLCFRPLARWPFPFLGRLVEDEV